ncbi:hypothetical protein HY524_02300 [Candidatus Berkelbacteria bacterium]|nr:hypothetical protein [Candidatus Berkelbacteria bacterium]
MRSEQGQHQLTEPQPDREQIPVSEPTADAHEILVLRQSLDQAEQLVTELLKLDDPEAALAKLNHYLQEAPTDGIAPLVAQLALEFVTRQLLVPSDPVAERRLVELVTRIYCILGNKLYQVYKRSNQGDPPSMVEQGQRYQQLMYVFAQDQRVPPYLRRDGINTILNRHLWTSQSDQEMWPIQTFWIKERLGCSSISQIASSQEIDQSLVERIGYARILSTQCGRPAVEKASLYSALGHTPKEEPSDSLAWRRNLQSLAVYKDIRTGGLEVELSVFFALGYKINYRSNQTISTSASAHGKSLDNDELVTHIATCTKEFVDRYGYDLFTPSEAEQLTREYYNRGTSQSKQDLAWMNDLDSQDQSALFTQARLHGSALHILSSFNGELEVLGLSLTDRNTARPMLIVDETEAVKWIMGELTATQLTPQIIRYLLLALDDVRSDYPVLDRVSYQTDNGKKVPLPRSIRQQLIDRLNWKTLADFRGELADNPLVIDPKSGFPELVIHAYAVYPERIVGYCCQLLLSTESGDRANAFELLERVLFVPARSLRDVAKHLVCEVLTEPKLIQASVRDQSFLESYKVITSLLPESESGQIDHRLFQASTKILSDPQSLMSREDAWRLRMFLAASGFLKQPSDVESLYPRAVAADSLPTEVASLNNDAEAQSLRELSETEWEQRFPVFGTNGTVRQYMEFFALETLEDLYLPEKWHALCQVNAELIGRYLEDLFFANESDRQLGDLELDESSPLRKLGFKDVRWDWHHPQLTITFRFPDDRTFTLTAPSLTEAFQPQGSWSEFFEPYLRAVLLQMIYQQISHDHQVDVISELDTFHLTCLSSPPSEPLQPIHQDWSSYESVPQLDPSVDPPVVLAPKSVSQSVEALSPVAPTVSDQVPEQWVSRILTDPGEIGRFFDQVVPFPDLSDSELKHLEDIRTAILATLHSEHRSRVLPTTGLTILIQSGQWLGRTNWDEMTGVLQVELKQAESGSTDLACVKLSYRDAMLLEIVLERDGLLKLANGIDLAQRTAVEVMVLRCLEQAVVRPTTLPSISSTPEPNAHAVTIRPDATTVPCVDRLRDPNELELANRSVTHSLLRETGELEVTGRRTIPGRRVWAGHYRDPSTLEIKARQPSPRKIQEARGHGIELISATRPHPDDPDQRLTIYTTFRSEYDRVIMRKKPSES